MENRSNRKFIRMAAAAVWLVFCLAVLICAPAVSENGIIRVEHPLTRGTTDFPTGTEKAAEQYILQSFGLLDRPLRRMNTALTGSNAVVLEALADMAREVAAGERTSTVCEIPVENLIRKTSYTAADLGVDRLIENNKISESATEAFYLAVENEAQIDIRQIINSLRALTPYDLYWYGNQYRYGFPGCSSDGELIFFAEGAKYVVNMAVSVDYSVNGLAETTEYDTAYGTRVQTAAANAQAIVTANVGLSDYAKLNAYREAICDAVVYDDDAADENNNTPYGDPWQAVSVFDGDESTNVVCEGYSKAFKYLCDLSSFHSQVSASLVTGLMNGGTGAGDHMWNLVNMNGTRYLVDVTNCDSGTIGAPDKLFMAGYIREYQETNGNRWGYVYEGNYGSEVSYLYDAETIGLYSVEELTVSDEGYEGCSHPYTYLSEEWLTDDAEYEAVDNAYHNETATVRTDTVCGECGAVLETDEDRQTRKIKHEYDGNNDCHQCGHHNTCEHPAFETRAADYDEVITPENCEEIEGDNLYHLYTGPADLYDECTECLMQFNSRHADSANVPVEHVYSRGKCELCGHECTHEFGEFEKTGEKSECVRDNSETHHVIIWAQRGHSCTICGQGEACPDEIESESEPEPHTDQNGDGLCDVCCALVEDYWDFRLDGDVLYLEGVGPVSDYESAAEVPWYESRARIHRVVIDAEINRIGANALAGLPDGVRVDFRGNRMPQIDDNAFSGTRAVCRYTAWSGSWIASVSNADTYGGTLTWRGLPVFFNESESNEIRYSKEHGWAAYGYDTYGGYFEDIRLTTAQAEELTWRNRRIVLKDIPSKQADRNLYEGSWSVVSGISFENAPEGTGAYALEITGNDSVDVCVMCDGLALTIDAGRIGSLDVENGSVTVTGNTGKVRLNGGSGDVVIGGDVDVLEFMPGQFEGNLTVGGTISRFCVCASDTTVDIPNIGNDIPLAYASQVLLENYSQAGLIIQDGGLNVEGGTSVSGKLDLDNYMLHYRYSRQGSGWSVDVCEPGADPVPVGTVAIGEYKPDFTAGDIYWSGSTWLTVSNDYADEELCLSGTPRTGETWCLARLTVTGGAVQVNCPVKDIRVIHDTGVYSPSVGVAISAHVGSLYAEQNRIGWDSIFTGVGGSVDSGVWVRSWGSALLFENVRQSTEILDYDSLLVMSREQGQSVYSVLPPDSMVSWATGNGENEVARMDLDEVAMEDLTSAEAQALTDYAGNYWTVSGILDLSVRKYRAVNGMVAGSGELVEELNDPVSVRIRNMAEGRIQLVHLRTIETGTTVQKLYELTDAAELEIDFCRSGKYVILSVSGDVETPDQILARGNILYLPDSLEVIETGAFENVDCEAVYIPDGCRVIEAGAFLNCEKLKYVSCPSGISKDDAFDAFVGCHEKLLIEER